MGIHRVTAAAGLAIFVAAACGQAIVDDGPAGVVPGGSDGGLGDGTSGPTEGGADAVDGAPVGPDGGPASCGRRDGGRWLVFVTEGSYPGDHAKGTSNGGTTIDALCASIAQDAGFTGTFMAYVASPPDAPHERIATNGPGWDRPDGVQVFAAPDPSAQLPNAPIDMTERCTLVTDNTGVWTGVSPDGVVAQSCGDWNMTASEGHYGDPRSTSSTWQAQDLGACSVSRHFYCFQVSN